MLLSLFEKLKHSNTITVLVLRLSSMQQHMLPAIEAYREEDSMSECWLQVNQNWQLTWSKLWKLVLIHVESG